MTPDEQNEAALQALVTYARGKVGPSNTLAFIILTNRIVALSEKYGLEFIDHIPEVYTEIDYLTTPPTNVN